MGKKTRTRPVQGINREKNLKPICAFVTTAIDFAIRW